MGLWALDHAGRLMIFQHENGYTGTRPRWAAEAACCHCEARLRGLGVPDLILKDHKPPAVIAKPAHAGWVYRMEC